MSYRLPLRILDRQLEKVVTFVRLKMVTYTLQLDFENNYGEPSFIGFPDWLQPLIHARYDGDYEFCFDTDERYYYLDFPTEEEKLIFIIRYC